MDVWHGFDKATAQVQIRGALRFASRVAPPMPDRPGHHHPHRFPAAIIAYAVWFYHRFALTLRDVEELLFERGIKVTYEAIRTWVVKFGALRGRAAQAGGTTRPDVAHG
jgi:hypothetical protein